MENISINSTNKVNNANSHDRNYDWTKDKLLLNLWINMEEQRFYALFKILEKDKRDIIIKEIQLFTQGTSSFWRFLNNICATLTNRYWAFWNISLEIIDYLKYLAKNDTQKLKDIYKNLTEITK